MLYPGVVFSMASHLTQRRLVFVSKKKIMVNCNLFIVRVKQEKSNYKEMKTDDNGVLLNDYLCLVQLDVRY